MADESLSDAQDRAHKRSLATDEPQFAYVFMHRRPRDKQAWPVLYQDRTLAERCEFRVSRIVSVLLPRMR